MDRNRITKQIKANGIPWDGQTVTVISTLGEGGNGTALLCKTRDGKEVVAKVYLPPDKRDLDGRALARFESEIKLTSKIRHPNVIRALHSGRLTLGAYSLPFYLMPRAAKTLRDFTGRHGDDPSVIETRMRLFLRAALGVACLHSHGVVHRDLKPENILIDKGGNAWVADLGIAHVNPDFVSVGVKTMAAERLLNRDYYAPEQRFGKATEVDARADTYALGCILYELLTGSPPVRSSSPALSKINPAFARLDEIFGRMTAYDKKDRYEFLEEAIEELSVAFGWILATMKGARPAESADVPTMTRLLKSSNQVHRQRGILIASQLREEALPTLHELSGHSRRDVRNAAASALGEIGHASSLPFLVGCLYGGGNLKPSTFRPAADTAAAAIGRYPLDAKLQVCAEIAQPVRPAQILQILKAVDKDAAYTAVQAVIARGMLLLDWAETPLSVLASIDEERTWPAVVDFMRSREQNGFRAREIAEVLSTAHKREFLDLWIDRSTDAWYFDYILKAILAAGIGARAEEELLAKLYKAVRAYRGVFKNQTEVLTAIEEARLSRIEHSSPVAS